ncbi:MAG: hypothetical protein Q8939_04170 [Bacteroidota bacterium]|nr:hypothetical protein [Bacteroidota bacterium]
MKRRELIKQAALWGLAAHPLTKAFGQRSPEAWTVRGKTAMAGLTRPVFVYNNWSAHDELSDNVAQTELLSLRELDEILRLKKSGVQIDYYVMDAFWFDKRGGYREWNKQHWPNGPDKWLSSCKLNNILPGMWFSTNLIATHSGRFLEVIDAWKDSLATDPNILCLFEGGYLNHLEGSLQLWYDRGVRLFKFDFANFEAVTPASENKYSPEQVQEKNKQAFMGMLQRFRAKNDDVLITGYNGFGGDMENTFAPFKKDINLKWLEVFETLCCGDPRFSDVPMMNIWRSADNYSDHMVRQFEFNGLPLRRIDNCAFMIGKTGTCYYRGIQAWKGMLILELARGGWMNVYHGNLELLNDADAKWFAKTQRLYHELQIQDKFSSFGEIPGSGKPYGFRASGLQGVVCTIVNPSQAMATVSLPVIAKTSAVLYADGGYRPVLRGSQLSLGPEQLVVVGFDQYATDKYNLGRDESISIPVAISKINGDFKQTGKNKIEATIAKLPVRNIRIIFQQFDSKGLPYRTWGGAPPDGKKMDMVFKIHASQNGKPLPLHIEYDKMIWSGLSWAAGEISADDLDFGRPLIIECLSNETQNLDLKADVYAVGYSNR